MKLTTLCDSADSDDDRLSVSASEQTVRLRIRQADGSDQIKECIGHKGRVQCVAISPDNRWFASGAPDSVVKIWSAESGELLRDCSKHTKTVSRIVFSSDKQYLLSGDEAGATIIWDTVSWSPKGFGPPHCSPVTALAFSADGLSAASAYQDGTVMVWEPGSGKSIASWSAEDASGQNAAAFALAFSPDSRLIASGGPDSVVRIGEVPTGRRLVPCLGHRSTVTAVAFYPDGHLLASGGEDTTVKIWEVATGRKMSDINEPRVGAVRSLRFSPSGTLALKRFPLQPREFFISPDGRVTMDPSPPDAHFVVSSDGRAIGTPDTIGSVAFSSNGLLVAAGSWNGAVRIWETQTGAYRRSSGHNAAVYRLVFAPDSRLLASASEDNVVKIWDVQNCACLGTLFYDSRVAIAFTDGQPLHLIVVDRAGSARGYAVEY